MNKTYLEYANEQITNVRKLTVNNEQRIVGMLTLLAREFAVLLDVLTKDEVR